MKCVYHAQPRDSLRLPRQISGRLSQDKPVPVLLLLCMFSLFSWPLIRMRLIGHTILFDSIPDPPGPRATMCIHSPYPLVLVSMSMLCEDVSKPSSRNSFPKSLVWTPSITSLLYVFYCPQNLTRIAAALLRAAYRHPDQRCRTARPPLPARFAKLTNLKACPL